MIWACVVQSVGTVLFNFNTVDAMFTSFDTEQKNRLVWGPDMLGSAAFLIASHLAWLAVCGGIWAVRRDDADWWVAALNYVGSIFFGLSAIASFTLPTTGDLVNTTIANAGTFLGAVCFFVGAYLLLPAARDGSGCPVHHRDQVLAGQPLELDLALLGEHDVVVRPRPRRRSCR